MEGPFGKKRRKQRRILEHGKSQYSRSGEEWERIIKKKVKAMASSKSWLFLLFFSFPFLLTVAASSLHEHGSFGRRVLMSFKETPEGTNVTFECSRSGPCVRCLYSEKVDEKNRCSETGYRIPFKCVEVQDGSHGENKQKSQKSRSTFEISDSSANAIKQRNLVDDSSTVDDVSQAYITYRSCIPPVDEERLSVVGFEAIVLLLLIISGSGVYFRRKKTVTMPGVASGRIQTNSRF